MVILFARITLPSGPRSLGASKPRVASAGIAKRNQFRCLLSPDGCNRILSPVCKTRRGQIKCSLSGSRKCGPRRIRTGSCPYPHGSLRYPHGFSVVGQPFTVHLQSGSETSLFCKVSAIPPLSVVRRSRALRCSVERFAFGAQDPCTRPVHTTDIVRGYGRLRRGVEFMKPSKKGCF